MFVFNKCSSAAQKEVIVVEYRKKKFLLRSIRGSSQTSALSLLNSSLLLTFIVYIHQSRILDTTFFNESYFGILSISEGEEINPHVSNFYGISKSQTSSRKRISTVWDDFDRVMVDGVLKVKCKKCASFIVVVVVKN